MAPLYELHYVRELKATRANAIAIIKMTREDVKRMGVRDLSKYRDPSNESDIAEQTNLIMKHPERYSGFVLGKNLVAFMKQNGWHVLDALPFARFPLNILLLMLHVVEKVFRVSIPTGRWGVFALVASDELSEDEREFVLSFLLSRSYKDAELRERTVNIPLVDSSQQLDSLDAVYEIALRHGFEIVGKPGEAAGAPGVKQHLYQRLPMYR